MKSLYNGQIIKLECLQEYDHVEIFHNEKLTVLNKKITEFHLFVGYSQKTVYKYSNANHVIIENSSDSFLTIKFIKINKKNPVGVLDSIEFQSFMKYNDLQKKESCTIFSETFIIKNIVLEIENYFIDDTLYSRFKMNPDFLKEHKKSEFNIFINNFDTSIIKKVETQNECIYQFRIKNVNSFIPISYTFLEKNIVFHIYDSFKLDRYIDIYTDKNKNNLMLKIIKNIGEKIHILLKSEDINLSENLFELKNECNYKNLTFFEKNLDKIEKRIFISFNNLEYLLKFT